jgi:hypothetical protein
MMTFGEAVEELKLGKQVTRVGWNGKGMFLFYVGGAAWTVHESLEHLVAGMVGQSWIAMKTAQEMITPWAPAQSDVLSNDWGVVNE